MLEKLSVTKEQQKREADSAQSKRQFTEPKLKFIEPQLTKYGDATKITAGFFGTFST